MFNAGILTKECYIKSTKASPKSIFNANANIINVSSLYKWGNYKKSSSQEYHKNNDIHGENLNLGNKIIQ